MCDHCALHNLQRQLSEMVEPELVESSKHPYGCRCATCKRWWKLMGKDPGTNRYGPFDDWEIEDPDGPRHVLLQEGGS